MVTFWKAPFFLIKNIYFYEDFFRSKFDILCDDIYSGTFLLSKFVSTLSYAFLPSTFPFSFVTFQNILDLRWNLDMQYLFYAFNVWILPLSGCVNFIVVQNSVILKGKMLISSA